MDVVGALGLILAYFLVLVVTHDQAHKRGKREGFKDGYQQGFKDAREFSELWWTVAEKQVAEERKKIWKEEERWP